MDSNDGCDEPCADQRPGVLEDARPLRPHDARPLANAFARLLRSVLEHSNPELRRVRSLLLDRDEPAIAPPERPDVNEDA